MLVWLQVCMLTGDHLIFLSLVCQSSTFARESKLYIHQGTTSLSQQLTHSILHIKATVCIVTAFWHRGNALNTGTVI